ncbi:MAG: butyrate kinase [Calditerrivibrio sp.]|nr:butyrate kinase [Calditerrivibrio sp.]
MIIIAIDPGSTSTKIGIFKDSNLFKQNIQHDRQEIDKYKNIIDQKDFRFSLIKQTLNNFLPYPTKVDVIIGRGGLIKPIKGGIYKVNEQMLHDLKVGVMGQHAANLGGIIAYELAKIYSCEAYITNPPVIDEMIPIAKVTGLKGIERKSMFHALNQKATAMKVSKKIGKSYEEVNLIVAHLGGGISVGIHSKGSVIDVNNALDGDGPFSPERAGSLPVDGVLELLKNGSYTIEELRNTVSRKAGLYSYLNTVDLREVEKMIDKGDENAKLYYEAMAYQVAKEIGALAPVVSGDIDGIILTGGLAHSERFINLIIDRIKFLGKIFVEPGENEIEALIEAGLRVLTGEETPKEYL